jgi:putative membrane protein
MSNDETAGEKVLRGALAGLVAGAVASFAMDRFQAGVAALGPKSDADGESEPATEKAADAVAREATGHAVPEPDKPLAG